MLFCVTGGVELKTLFVYCSGDDTVNSLCSESVLRKRDTKALELNHNIHKSAFSRYFGIHRVRRFSSVGSYGVDVDEFDKIIFACDEYMGEIPPEVCAFITKNNLRYKTIDCIVFGDGRNVQKAKNMLRNRISLSGGTVRNIISISVKELKREEEDVLFSVRHRMAV